jgi:hypothetical protein
LVKSLIAQALEKRKDEQHDILHTIRIFEGKFEAMCKVVFGIGISVTQVTDEDENIKQEEVSLGLGGTQANPLF